MQWLHVHVVNAGDLEFNGNCKLFVIGHHASLWLQALPCTACWCISLQKCAPDDAYNNVWLVLTYKVCTVMQSLWWLAFVAECGRLHCKASWQGGAGHHLAGFGTTAITACSGNLADLPDHDAGICMHDGLQMFLWPALVIQMSNLSLKCLTCHSKV